MPIPIGNEYTAYSSGSVDKFVRCEKCGEEYVYALFRDVSARATSLLFADNVGASNRASDRAQGKLERALSQGVDPVPCPNCGYFQPDMVREARRRRLSWMGFRRLPLWLFGWVMGSFLLVIVNGVAARVGPLIKWEYFFSGLVAIGVVIVLLPFIRLVIISRYDANDLNEDERRANSYFAGEPRSGYEERKTQECAAVELAQQPETQERLRKRVEGFLARPVQPGQHLEPYLVRYLDGAALGPALGFSIDTAHLLASSRSMTTTGAEKEYFQELADILKAITAEVHGRWPR
jgi:hypothetical protein